VGEAGVTYPPLLAFSVAAMSSIWTRYTRLTLSRKRIRMKTKQIFIQYWILATRGLSEMKLQRFC
jgi:hypothetical protein